MAVPEVELLLVGQAHQEKEGQTCRDYYKILTSRMSKTVWNGWKSNRNSVGLSTATEAGTRKVETQFLHVKKFFRFPTFGFRSVRHLWSVQEAAMPFLLNTMNITKRVVDFSLKAQGRRNVDTSSSGGQLNSGGRTSSENPIIFPLSLPIPSLFSFLEDSYFYSFVLLQADHYIKPISGMHRLLSIMFIIWDPPVFALHPHSTFKAIEDGSDKL